MIKCIVLCADDYGQAPAISQGIVSLVQRHRLSAVSCMVNTRFWNEHARWLAPFQSQIDIGLHFNLTEGESLTPQFRQAYGDKMPSLIRLMYLAFSYRLNQKLIEDELHAQLDCFANALGFLPDFIDGHQHVHQFPLIRTALMQVYKARLQQKKIYIRSIYGRLNLNNITRHFKEIIIYLSGGKALKKLIKKYNIPHNQSFTGIYSFTQSHHYARLFPHFLKESDDRGLIMCHPGLASAKAKDCIAKARFHEYQYLSSDQFLIDCRTHGVSLTRYFRYT